MMTQIYQTTTDIQEIINYLHSFSTNPAHSNYTDGFIVQFLDAGLDTLIQKEGRQTALYLKEAEEGLYTDKTVTYSYLVPCFFAPKKVQILGGLTNDGEVILRAHSVANASEWGWGTELEVLEWLATRFPSVSGPLIPSSRIDEVKDGVSIQEVALLSVEDVLELLTVDLKPLVDGVDRVIQGLLIKPNTIHPEENHLNYYLYKVNKERLNEAFEDGKEDAEDEIVEVEKMVAKSVEVEEVIDPVQQREELLAHWERFIGPNGLNIKGVSRRTIERLAEGNVIDLNNFASLYVMDETKFTALKGFGQRSWENIQAALNESKSVDMEVLLNALGVNENIDEWVELLNQLKGVVTSEDYKHASKQSDCDHLTTQALHNLLKVGVGGDVNEETV